MLKSSLAGIYRTSCFLAQLISVKEGTQMGDRRSNQLPRQVGRWADSRIAPQGIQRRKVSEICSNLCCFLIPHLGEFIPLYTMIVQEVITFQNLFFGVNCWSLCNKWRFFSSYLLYETPHLNRCPPVARTKFKASASHLFVLCFAHLLINN